MYDPCYLLSSSLKSLMTERAILDLRRYFQSICYYSRQGQDLHKELSRVSLLPGERTGSSRKPCCWGWITCSKKCSTPCMPCSDAKGYVECHYSLMLLFIQLKKVSACGKLYCAIFYCLVLLILTICAIWVCNLFYGIQTILTARRWFRRRRR